MTEEHINVVAAVRRIGVECDCLEHSQRVLDVRFRSAGNQEVKRLRQLAELPEHASTLFDPGSCRIRPTRPE